MKKEIITENMIRAIQDAPATPFRDKDRLLACMRLRMEGMENWRIAEKYGVTPQYLSNYIKDGKGFALRVMASKQEKAMEQEEQPMVEWKQDECVREWTTHPDYNSEGEKSEQDGGASYWEKITRCKKCGWVDDRETPHCPGCGRKMMPKP